MHFTGEGKGERFKEKGEREKKVLDRKEKKNKSEQKIFYKNKSSQFSGTGPNKEEIRTKNEEKFFVFFWFCFFFFFDFFKNYKTENKSKSFFFKSINVFS